MTGTDIGYYTLPVLLSFDGVDRQINSSIGKALGSVATKGGKDFGKQFVQSSESELKRLGDTYRQVYDKAADAADKLKVAQAGIEDLEKKGITTGQRWERAQAAKSKATRDHERAVRTATDAYKDMERAQKSAEDAASRSGGGFLDRLKGRAAEAGSAGSEAASGFVEGFGGPIAALGTKAGPIGLALAAAAGLALGAGALIGQQVMAGMDREVASDRLAAQLGLSDTEAAAFGHSAGAVYGEAFGTSLGDVNEAIAAVASTLGKDTPAAVIEDMTAKALTFRDVFGTEVSESIAHAQNLIVNGLAPDATGAFDLMTKAFQEVPVAMRDELPEILNEYSTYFQSLGFSGAEAFGLLVNTAPKGKIALDKLGDSLKEFTLLATDIGAKPVQDALMGMGLSGADVANNLLAGGDAAQRQFDQIIDGLLGIPDAGQQAAAAIALFGTPLEDLDKAKIPDFLRSLDNADQAMSGFAGSAQAMVDRAGDNAATTVESAKRAVEMAMGGMQDTMAQAFGPYVEQFAGFVTEHQDEIVHAFQWMAGGATEFGAAVGMAAGGSITILGTLMQVVGDTSGWIIDGFEGMVGAAATVAEAFGQDGMASDLRDAQQTLAGYSDRLHDAGTDVSAFGVALAQGSNDLRTWDGSMGQSAASAKNAAAQIDGVKQAMGQLPGGKQINIDAIVVFKDQNGRPLDPSQGFTSQRQMDAAGVTPPARGWWPSMARPSSELFPVPAPTGGAGNAFGAPPSTITPAPAPRWSAPASMTGGGGGGGGASASTPPPQFDRALWGLDAVPPSGIDQAILSQVPAGRYTQTDGADLTQGLADCSSAVEDLVALMEGRPTGGRSLSTHNADQWLPANGFLPGAGGPGDMRVAFNSGHMQATLPDGTPFNWGSDAAAARGGVGSLGADDPALTSRYYKPANTGGFATPGATSTAGGYAVDPQAVFDAESAVLKDQNELEQKRLRLLELQATGNAKQSELLAAQNDVAEQERDLQSSQSKLTEARQGKLQKAAQSQKSGSSGGSGSGGMGGLGELGSIFGSFLKETTGLDGSFLPDFADSSTMQSVGALMNAFRGPLQGLVDGGLGIQQPGWQPGMPVPGQESSTGGAAFGMPDVAVPPMPPAGQHGGSGAAPGPAGGSPVSIDASTTIQGNVGWSADEIEQRRKRNESRAVSRASGTAAFG